MIPKQVQNRKRGQRPAFNNQITTISHISRRWLCAEDSLDEMLVVDISILVDFSALEQLIHLLIGQLLTQAGEDIAQLTAGNQAIVILVKDLEALDEFLNRALGLGTRHRLGLDNLVEEDVKGDGLLLLFDQFGNLRLCGIEADGAQQVSDRRRFDGTITLLVIQRECFLILYIDEKTAVIHNENLPCSWSSVAIRLLLICKTRRLCSPGVKPKKLSKPLITRSTPESVFANGRMVYWIARCCRR